LSVSCLFINIIHRL